MEQNKLIKTINKGIPSFIDIELDIDTLIKECSNDEEKAKEELYKYREQYHKAIINIISYDLLNCNSFKKLRIGTEYKTSFSRFYISQTPFIEILKKELEVNNNSIDYNDQELFTELKNKIEILKNITTPEELQQHFPLIYFKYLKAISSSRIINKLKETHPKEIIDFQEKRFKEYALHINFNIFLKKKITLYRNAVYRRQFIEGYTTKNPLNFDLYSLDKDKLELYIASKYIEKLLSVDIEEKQKCIFYLAAYFNEEHNKDITITNENNEIITYQKLYNIYKRVLSKNIILRPINEDREHFTNYHIRHVENHIKKYFNEDVVDWNIFPKDKKIDERIINYLNSKYNYLSPEERKKKIEKLYELLERKVLLLNSSNYTSRIWLPEIFNGYIMYIYNNGYVILEKFFTDEKETKPAQDTATYIIRAMYLDKINNLTKKTIKKVYNAKAIYHNKNWESKIQSYIEQPETNESKEEVKQLLLRIKQ